MIVPTDVASSNEGQIVIIGLFVIRDIVTLLVGIVLNVTLLIQMRNYLIERAKRFGLNVGGGNGLSSVQTHPTASHG